MPFVHDGGIGRQEARGDRQKRGDDMSETQRTTIARLQERLESLKERL
ncbi:MAG TPA: hypothetical protein VGG51_02775 [Candidatus Cybelea sp.]